MAGTHGALAEQATNKGQGLSPQERVRAQIDIIEPGLKAALPPHISVDRFKRVALTAINNNPDLLNADRRSLLNAFQKAAEDALLPDGRDGAVVIYRTKMKNTEGRDQWVQAAQWMPMVWGIVKNLRGSGAVLTISANVVYANDEFDYQLGDEEHIYHRPALKDRGEAIGVYAIAKLPGDMAEREYMAIQDIEQVRDASKASEKGPWGTWWSEMARKTVIRRLAKRLSLPPEMDRLVRRDDGIYTPDEPPAPAPLRPTRSSYVTSQALAERQNELDRARAQGMPRDPFVDMDDGEGEAEPAETEIASPSEGEAEPRQETSQEQGDLLGALPSTEQLVAAVGAALSNDDLTAYLKSMRKQIDAMGMDDKVVINDAVEAQRVKLEAAA